MTFPKRGNRITLGPESAESAWGKDWTQDIESLKISQVILFYNEVDIGCLSAFKILFRGLFIPIFPIFILQYWSSENKMHFRILTVQGSVSLVNPRLCSPASSLLHVVLWIRIVDWDFFGIFLGL